MCDGFYGWVIGYIFSGDFTLRCVGWVVLVCLCEWADWAWYCCERVCFRALRAGEGALFDLLVIVGVGGCSFGLNQPFAAQPK